MPFAALIVTLLALVACSPFSGFVQDDTLDGPYRLVAVDTDEDMALCRSPPGVSDCMGDGFPGPTVFAAGANARYIVIARHPREWPSPPDRSVTQYYYLVRTPDEATKGLPSGNVRGPFTQAQFTEQQQRLALPDFSRVFERLK
jgi:hypothetical protein